MTSKPTKVIEVFISYAHKDERLRNELEKHLAILRRNGYITIWHDRRIAPGKVWGYEINTNLTKANIILLLISPDFMASDYCDSVEVKQALKRHEAGECRVIPVILRPVSWQDAAFSTLRALPANGKPVTEWSNRDKAFLDITEGIRNVVEELSASMLAETSEIPPVLEFHQASALPLSQVEMKDEQASLAAKELENKGVVSHDRDEEQFDGTNELTESLQLEENILNMSALTVQQVNDSWEDIRKRTKQKSKSGLTAAYLGYYKVIAIEGTAEQPIVVIQAAKQVHFEYVKTNDRYKDLEWALDMEFSLPCQVRLIPPGQPLSAAPGSDSTAYATSAAPTIAPQEPAHLERPVTLSPNPPEEIPGAGMQTPISQLAQPGYEDSEAQPLTVQQVKDAWEDVRKLVKQKSKSGLFAAYLGYFEINGIEGTIEQPIIAILTEKEAAYKYATNGDRYKDLEWALTMKFGFDCNVRIILL